MKRHHVVVSRYTRSYYLNYVYVQGLVFCEKLNCTPHNKDIKLQRQVMYFMQVQRTEINQQRCVIRVSAKGKLKWKLLRTCICNERSNKYNNDENTINLYYTVLKQKKNIIFSLKQAHRAPSLAQSANTRAFLQSIPHPSVFSYRESTRPPSNPHLYANPSTNCRCSSGRASRRSESQILDRLYSLGVYKHIHVRVQTTGQPLFYNTRQVLVYRSPYYLQVITQLR